MTSPEPHPTDSRAPTWTPPAVYVICGTILISLVLICAASLIFFGKEVDDFTRFLNTMMNLLTVFGVIGGVSYSAKSYQASKTAANRLNGELDYRIQNAITRALEVRDQNGTQGP